MKLATLLLLASGAAAVRMRLMDSDYERSMIQEMDEAANPQSRSSIVQKFAELNKQDTDVAEEYAKQLDQAKRNAQ